jgi:hypothetical protein
MKEQIIIHTVEINHGREVKYFEIPLPHDMLFIRGLWYKIRLLDDADRAMIVYQHTGKSTYQPAFAAGVLSLSSNKREGVFFYGNLLLENRSLGMLDFSAGAFPVRAHTHGKKFSPLDLRIDARTSCIHGFLEDKWGLANEMDINYQVDIYLLGETSKNTPD